MQTFYLLYFTSPILKAQQKERQEIRMFKYIKRFWKDNLLVGLLLLGRAGSQTIASVVSARALNALVDFDFQGFLNATLTMFGVFMFLLLFTYVEIVKQTQTTQKMVTAIRADITARMENTSYNGFHEKQVGTYASWLSNDMNTIETQAFEAFYTVTSGIIATITSIIALFFFHWSLVAWSLIATGITLLLPRIYEKKMAKASLATTQENERFLSKANDVLSGFDTLFSYSLLKKISRDIRAASESLAEAKTNQARVIGKVAILGAFGNVFGQLTILVLTGWLAFRSLISIGSIASTGSLASVIFNNIGNISQQIATIRSTQPIFEKFETISQNETNGHEELEDLNEGFQINQLDYAFGEKQIFENINFTFDLGNKYAVIGPSGSGKSTLLNILNGKLTDYNGSVTLSNKELKEIDGQDLRNQILYIDQIPYLFEGTIRYNITLGEEFSEEALRQAIKDSDLEELIAKLPNGLDTSVGEAGRDLSGGQRQRIALARGLIRGKTCILLDEGTSSLDEESALRIEESLVTNPNLTVIMITHHLRETTKARLDGILALN